MNFGGSHDGALGLHLALYTFETAFHLGLACIYLMIPLFLPLLLLLNETPKRKGKGGAANNSHLSLSPSALPLVCHNNHAKWAAHQTLVNKLPNVHDKKRTLTYMKI